MVKQISDNEIYLLIKYIKSILWRVVNCLSYIEDAQCQKVKHIQMFKYVSNPCALAPPSWKSVGTAKFNHDIRGNQLSSPPL